MAPPTEQWVSIHIYYHDFQDQLVSRWAWPAVRDLKRRGLVKKGFFLRYWNGGSHIRLRALCSGGTSTVRVVENILLKSAKHFVSQFPSARRQTEGSYWRTAEMFAEHEKTTAVALQAVNSVHLAEYEQESEKFGTGDSMCSTETHFDQSSQFAWEIVSVTTDANQRMKLIIAALLTGWATYSRRDLAGPEPTSDSVAERLRNGASRQKRFSDLQMEPPAWEARATTLAASMVDELVREGSQAPLANVPGASRWMASMEELIGSLNYQHLESDKLASIPDICAHLLANRIGVNVGIERQLRRATARGVLLQRSDSGDV